MARNTSNTHPGPILLLILILVGGVWGIRNISYGNFSKDDPNSVQLAQTETSNFSAGEDTQSKKIFRDYLESNFETSEIVNLNSNFQSFDKSIKQIITQLESINSFKVNEVVDGKEFAQGFYDHKNNLDYMLELSTGREEYNIGDFKYIKEKQDPKFVRLLSDELLIDENIKSKIYDITSRLVTEGRSISGAESYFVVAQKENTREYIYFENILSSLKFFHIVENKSENSYSFKFDNNIEDSDGFYSQKIFDINEPVDLNLEFGEDFRIWPPMPQTAQDKINNIFDKFKKINSVEYTQESGEEQKSLTEYKLDLRNNKGSIDHEAIVNDPFLYEYGNYVLVHSGNVDYFDTEKEGKFKIENKTRNLKGNLLEIQKSFYNSLNNLSRTVEFSYRQEKVQLDGVDVDRYLFRYNEPGDNSGSGNYPYTLNLTIDKDDMIKEVGGMRTDYGKVTYRFKSFNKAPSITVPSWSNTVKLQTVQ